LIPALKPFLVALLLFPMVAIGSSMLPPDYMMSVEYGMQPFYWKMGYMWLSMCACRCKYYYAWKISEGASNASGVGYRLVKTDNGSEVRW
jgi:hypothetical protein